jgi:carboxyl-terminal processing protease
MRISNIFLFIFLFIFFSCKKNDSTPQLNIKELQINKFIWSGLHNFYLWTDNIPDLSTNKFTSENKLDSFLNKYSDHEKLFYDLLNPDFDKWSFIVKDYELLDNQLKGITRSMGFEFYIASITTNNNLAGIVRYVFKDGPADKAGIKRGDIFFKVDDQYITKTNYKSLLMNKESYTLTFGKLSSVNKKVTLTTAKVIENPIYIDTVYVINNTRFGYLFCKSFIPEYDLQLNKIFQRFNEQGIRYLIIDLRYNYGGSINSARYLASMIYSTDTTKLFLNYEFNSNLHAHYDSAYGKSFSTERFADKIKKTENSAEEPINCVRFRKIYIITTGSTSSTSELLITCLRPYVEIVTLGSKTYGDCYGKFILKDYNNLGELNPDHKWAMLPVVMKVSNCYGTSYPYGILQDIKAVENLENLLPIGDTQEDLLNATLQYIVDSGVKSYKDNSQEEITIIADSKDFNPYLKAMNYKIINHIDY